MIPSAFMASAAFFISLGKSLMHSVAVVSELFKIPAKRVIVISPGLMNANLRFRADLANLCHNIVKIGLIAFVKSRKTADLLNKT